MVDFNATLTRAFAEAHEPTDDGFSVRIGHAVTRREKTVLAVFISQGIALSIGVALALWSLPSLLGAYGPEMLASAGLELARAHGAMTQASSINLASMAAGMTQILFAIGGLAGGALVYRSSQQQ